MRGETGEKGSTGLGGGAGDEVVEFPVCKVGCYGAVVAENRHLVFRYIDPATGFAVAARAPHQLVCGCFLKGGDIGVHV